MTRTNLPANSAARGTVVAGTGTPSRVWQSLSAGAPAGIAPSQGIADSHLKTTSSPSVPLQIGRAPGKEGDGVSGAKTAQAIASARLGLLTIDAAAEYLCVSVRTVKQLLSEGRLAYVKSKHSRPLLGDAVQA